MPLNISVKLRVINISILAVMVLASTFVLCQTAKAANYYVDSQNGEDSNTGQSPEDAWKTTEKVNSAVFRPGDKIHFRRGGVWTGKTVVLEIRNSGQENSPITFTAYGQGPKPVFTAEDEEWGESVKIGGSYITVEGLAAKGSFEAGFVIEPEADHNLIKNCEAVGVGLGILVAGRNNRIVENHIHDLHLIVNTPGSDDDYGAVGVWLSNGFNEIAYNRFENCRAPSHDYGYDGGAVEIYADKYNVDGNYIHHNRAFNCEGFLEVGARAKQFVRNNIVAYNLSVNNRIFFDIHLDGIFAANVSELRFENNTVVDTVKRNETEYYAFGFSGQPDPSAIQVRNNIFFLRDFWFVADTERHGRKLIHEYNLYFLGRQYAELGFPPGPGEMRRPPLFVDLKSGDYRLQKNSPAVDAAINLDYNLDLDGRPVPYGPKPDIGAYEYHPPQ